MKICPYCGEKYSDEVEACPIDHHALQPTGEQAFSSHPDNSPNAISPQEKQFWDRMTFRQFAILMVRLQALWLFFNAAIDVIYVPRYIIFSNRAMYSAVIAKPELFTLLLRILLNIAAGILIIQKAEKILRWMVKDLVSEQTVRPGKSAKDTTG